MKSSFLLACLATLFASTASAATLYVAPTGANAACCTQPGCCTRAAPCDLKSGANAAVAGDTVILMDGIYKTSLWLDTATGTADAWITFKADECATPIIEGSGAGPMDDVQDSGVGSATAQYVRFQGLVVRGWNIGFGNGWVGGRDTTDISNGHWEIEDCISYSNGRTGFTFFSAEGFTLKNSISAHNGSSQLHSWSSGVTLFEATGTNVVDGNISFENTDRQNHTDGSGFIVDENAHNATFINNIAFGNAGSCFRLTKSSGTKFINNTCYHDSQFGSVAMGPTNPSEVYFSNAGITQQDVTFSNNAIIGTGQAPAGAQPVINQPPMGWSNTNVVGTGTVAYFTAPTGTNPSFVPASGDTTLTGKGAAGTGVPTTDIGFDPKCLVKRTPVMVGQIASEAWWQYDIDIEYIQSIGGVGACFNPATRSGTPDVGAYKAGAVTAVTPGSCVAPPSEMAGMGGMGGAESCAGGTAGLGMGGDLNLAGASAGGAPSTGGTPSMAGTGAGPSSGGAVATGGTGTGGVGVGGAAGSAGGSPPSNAGTSPGTGGTGGTGTGGSTTTGGTAGSDSPPPTEPSGCGCRLTPEPHLPRSLAALGVLGLGLAALRRRRATRQRLESSQRPF